MKNYSGAVLLVLVFFGTEAHSSGLSKITGIHIDVYSGKMSIEPPDLGAIPQVIHDLPKDVAQAFLNPLAPALAASIRHSRQQAINRGAYPIPPNIRQQ